MKEKSKLQTVKASDSEDRDNHNNSFYWPRKVSEKQLA